MNLGLELQSVIAEALDQGKYAVVYTIDLPAAFDLLKLDTLMEELIRRSAISDGQMITIVDFLKK